ncbi:MAG: phosphoenolpyruvate carboxykinase [Caldithrix sp. RBG_13_44_9]|nr:MAG: phosphoenolpyruvate carboxykinase [Caldithrix sp. RBG_13_44_9]
MPHSHEQSLKERLGEDNFKKIQGIGNPSLNEFLVKFIEILNPEKVFVCTDESADIQYIREKALRDGEEQELAIPGQTVHYDNYFDQARDKKNTAILLPKGKRLDRVITTLDRETGLNDIFQILPNIMKGKELLIRFFCLGPTNSHFSIPAVQLTDSAYVAHSEDLLYRKGYQEFIRQGSGARFFKFIHSQGELDERKSCKNLDQRRVYIDLEEDTVYCTNTQYGGNTIGLKKLAMRLAINRGSQEGWLTEHMLVMGIRGPQNRLTYFTGAFPSLCGKTSTAMLEGENIVGDDIAYLRKVKDEVRAVNVERGIFGIIMGINSKDDPIQWNALHSPNELIYSNILVTPDKQAFWMGKDGEIPSKGYNHSGEWYPGKTDSTGKEIPPSHPNGRFTISLEAMRNLDPAVNDPHGVKIGGIVYGGRDADTSIPVEEAFNWSHGIIIKGAALESETTAATLGKAGVREFNPMSNLDFLSIPVGKYVLNNLDFGRNLPAAPKIFSVNYFLLDHHGKFLNEKNDKKIWYKWMELRVNREVDAIQTPTGRIPLYEDLKPLFKSILNKTFTEQNYLQMFTIRVQENLSKIERISEIYRNLLDVPSDVFHELDAQRTRLQSALKRFGKYISPFTLRGNRI